MDNKVKVIEREEPLSKSKIDKHKDFDGLLNKYQAQQKTGRNHFFLLWMVAIGVLISGLWVIQQASKVNNTSKNAIESELKTATLDSISPDSIALASILARPELQVDTLRSSKFEPKELKTKEENMAKDKEIIMTKTEKEKTKKNTFVDAYPLNGYAHLYEYFVANTQYPEAFRKDSIEGTVQVRFKVASDSSIISIKVVESLGDSFDAEAVRLIENMPPWVPASSGNTFVNRSFTIPIRFEVK